MAQSNTLVSIIMAVKDTAPYLPECLDSILAQTYSDWELIAINDHSTDGSKEILEQYAAKDTRIKVFESAGQKLIPALQTGYAHSSCSLINRMDSDDKMPEYKLEVMIKAWQKVGPGHVIAGGTQHFVDQGVVGDGFLRYDRWLNEVARRSSHFEEIYQECTIPSHCWLIHRADFDKVGAFNSDIYPEDYDLCFRLYKSGLKVIGLDKVLHFWRDRSDRISRTWEVYKDNRYFHLKFDNFYEIDRDPSRPLVLWGAGRNGKDLAKLILEKAGTFIWVCDNQKKIGKDIYGIQMEHYDRIGEVENPQIIIAIASPTDKKEISSQLRAWDKLPAKDFWFFS